MTGQECLRYGTALPRPGALQWFGRSRFIAGGLACALLAWPAAAPRGAEDLRRDATVAAIELVMPSVVNIATETVTEYRDWYDEMWRQFYGWSRGPTRQEKAISLGSGVIIDPEGYLLTNYHVVSRASRVQVKLWDGREYEAEPLIATASSDVALLKLKAKPGERFKGIRFAADDDLLLGETVLALGNPFGLGGSVTKGILSSKNRRPPTGKEPLKLEDWLETDAAINPGNSGGPLVNLRGELIGLNVAVYRPEEGMGLGFSIPIKQVSSALSHFFRPEFTDSLWFGAQLKAGQGPLVVTAVYPGSPAARAGMREGDQVVEVNNQAPAGIIGFNRLLNRTADQENRLVVSHGGERRTLAVRLLPLADLIRNKLGVTLREAKGPAAQRLGLTGDGLVIEEVERDGPAARAGLQKGLVITGMDGQEASEIRAVADVLLDKKRGDAVQLVVIAHRQLGAGLVETRHVPVKVAVR